MPRRDGFDTNKEMLADFNAQSREVFIAAYQRQFEDGLAPAFEDKPLELLTLDIDQIPISFQAPDTIAEDDSATRSNPDALHAQNLSINTLDLNDTYFMRDHLTMRHYPEEVLAHYDSVAKRLGDISLTSALDLGQVVPVEGIVASYTANLTSNPYGRSRHVDTFKEKPTKLSLALAKTFASEALEYVQSDAFDLSKSVGLEALIASAAESHRTGKRTKHSFGIRMTPETPLNGNESMAYLREYETTMNSRLTTMGPRVQRLEEVGAPEPILESAREQYNRYTLAARKVRAILDRK